MRKSINENVLEMFSNAIFIHSLILDILNVHV